jgi:gluconolactonase
MYRKARALFLIYNDKEFFKIICTCLVGGASTGTLERIQGEFAMNFATNLSFPEGPVALPDGGWLVVEMGVERGCVSRISPDGKTVTPIVKTGRPNGLAVDRDGVIWVAESLYPSVIRVTMDGKAETFLTECEGLPLLWPNDLAFGPDGLLYLTDSGTRPEVFNPGEVLVPHYQSLPYDGRVIQINTRTRESRIIDRGYRFTNGIAFGADGCLYANETLTGNVYRYQAQGKGFGPRETYSNVIDPQAAPGFKGPDGMKFAANGDLYCTVFGQGDCTVIAPGGSIKKRIHTAGHTPTNVAFGLNGEKRIYVTETELGNLEIHDTDTGGLPLYD